MIKKLKTNWLILLVTALAFLLRFYQLGTNPPSPYWEEAALGFDAYSILKTGKDFHGNFLPLVAFESFGDYKPSLYFYATVPFITIFGLNVFAVRFASAFFGSLTIPILYLLVKHLNKDKSLASLSALFLAIVPWHVQISRVGFEANLGLFLLILGIYFFYLGLKKSFFLLWSAFVFGLSLYSYHSYRILVPLLGLGLVILNLKSLLGHVRASLIAALLFVLMLIPIVKSINDPVVQTRFQQTSAFSDLKPIIDSNRLIAEDGSTRFAKIIHHRYWHYLKLVAANYLDHFHGNFLFVSGDANPRHSNQQTGQLFLVFLPLLLLAATVNKFLPSPLAKLSLLLLFLSPLPAALTQATPHALRSLSLVIPLVILSALGFSRLLRHKLLATIVAAIILIEFTRFQYVYHYLYPKAYSSQWQYGYQELIDFINSRYGNYDQIYISREQGRPSIYYWFYSKTDPRHVQAANSSTLKDQGEFLQYDKINFGPLPETISPKSLMVLSGSQNPPATSILIKEITNLNQEIVFRLYEI